MARPAYLSIVGFMCLCVTPAIAQENLVTNPGFETVRDGGPESWGKENWKTGGTWAVDEAVARGGSRSARVDCATDANRAIWRQIVPVNGPASMRFSAWYRTAIESRTNGRGAVARLIVFKDASKWQELSLQMFPGPPSQDWRELTATLFLPSEATSVGIELFNMDAAGSVWWDDVMLRKATDAERREEGAQRLEKAPAPYTVRYAPAEGAVSQLDPPAFVWLPVEGAGEYVLQFSRDEDFRPEETTSVTCGRTIYVPRQTLGAGQWYWRFAIKGEESDADAYSRTRGFTIAPEAAPVPFPDVRQVVANAAPHPRDFVHPDDLPRLRELGRGPLKSYADGITRTADRVIGGELLPEPEFLPAGGQERIVAYTKTFRTTRPFNSEMMSCATAYLITGEDKYGQEARRRLLYLATWDPEGSTSLFHNDEPGTELVRVMSRAYDWVHGLLTEEEREKVRTVLAVRMAQLYKVLTDKPFEVRPYESHAMDYYIGDLLESCICMAGEIPVEEMLEYVLQQLWSPFFPPYGGDDGGWCEGPAYWGWSTGTFLRNFTLVSQNCGVDLTRKPWLQNTPYFRLYCNPPYAKMSPFGDGQSGGPSAPDIMYKLGVALNNPYALWYANQARATPGGLDRFLYYREDDKGAPPSDLPQARCFEDVGLACMHSDLADGSSNVQFLMRSCPFGAISHAYADQNDFALFAYGEPLAIPSGYYPYYGSPHHSKWSWETKAANCILVDGQGQSIRDWDSRGRIVRFATSDVAHYARGDASEAYGGVLKRCDRHALFLRPTVPEDEPVIVLFDDLVSSGTSTYQWLLHSLEQMQVDESAGTVTIQRNAARLGVQFLTPQGLRFSQTDQFTVAPEAPNMPNQWHLTAETTEPAGAMRFVTVLAPYREGQAGQAAQARLLDVPGWVVVELTTEHTRQLAAFRTEASPGATATVDGVTISGDVFTAAWSRDGQLRAVMQVDSDGGQDNSGQ